MPESYRTIFYLNPKGASFPIQWLAIGEDEVSTSKYDWHGLHRKREIALLWQITLDGEGRIDIGDQKGISVGRGSSILAFIPSDHRYYYRRGDKPWKFNYIMIRGPAIEAFFRSSCKRDAYVLSGPSIEPSLKKIQALMEMYQDREPSPWQNVADTMEILLPLLQLAQTIDLTGLEMPPSEEKGKTKLMETIYKNPSLPVDKEGWAENQGLSRYQLYRRVKAQTGMSPKELRNRHRLGEAIRYLKRQNVSIADAATLAGFSSQNYFTRFFRKHTGFSPTEWKKHFAPSDA